MNFDEDLPKARPVTRWPGGKARLCKYLVPLIPEHDLYVEPSFGGGAVFFAKPESRVEVINDFNKDLVRFYRCVRFHLETLLDEMDYILNSRQEVEDFREQRGLTDIQRAARWYIINILSFGGTGEGFIVQRTQPIPSRNERMVKIRSLARRLDRTAVENLSWEKCVKIYDGLRTFFFFDPPYLDAGGAAYLGWSELQLEQFCQAILQIQGKWLFTFQDCEQVRHHMKDFEILEIERANGIGNAAGAKGRTYREVIISSEKMARTNARKEKGA